MGSSAGAEATAAHRIGVTVEEYRRRRAEGQKWCHRCRAWHPVDRFGADVSRTDGLSASCRTSRLGERSTDGPGRAERRTMAAMGLAWCRDCRWWLPLEEVERGRCRPHVLAAERDYYARTPARKHRATGRRMRGIPAWWREEMLAEGCAYCGAPAVGLDHFIPVSRGGETTPGNLVPACKSCNSMKRDQDPMLWIVRLDDLSRDRLCSRTLTWTGAIAELLEAAV
jgi:hypothetical protein